MLFWNKICGFLAFFFICALYSSAQKVPALKTSAILFSQKEFLKPSALQIAKTTEQEFYLVKPLSIIPQNYYTEHFGIMCKKELNIEKATKIPFRFRLGSLQQCNYLEGKR